MVPSASWYVTAMSVSVFPLSIAPTRSCCSSLVGVSPDRSTEFPPEMERLGSVKDSVCASVSVSVSVSAAGAQADPFHFSTWPEVAPAWVMSLGAWVCVLFALAFSALWRSVWSASVPVIVPQEPAPPVLSAAGAQVDPFHLST